MKQSSIDKGQLFHFRVLVSFVFDGFKNVKFCVLSKRNKFGCVKINKFIN